MEGLNPRFDVTGVDVNIFPLYSKEPAGDAVWNVPEENSNGTLLVVPANNLISALVEVRFVIEAVVALNEEIGSSKLILIVFK